MNKIITFLHSGKAGDCIASLSFVKHICAREQAKAVFYLDSTGGLASGDDEINSIVQRQTHGKPLNFPKSVCEFLKPLIEAQQYVANVQIVDKADLETLPHIDYDLNEFRKCFLDRKLNALSRTNLEYAHYAVFGEPLPTKLAPWLSVQPKYSPKPVIIARTPRYTSAHLWIACQEQILKKDAMFIGTEFEHKIFQETFDFAPEYYKVKDALEAAELIAGCHTFIANGTLLYWIAVGLGHPEIVHELCVDVHTTYYGSAANNIQYIVGGRISK